MPESKKRIYAVVPKAGDDKARLVRAATNISALSHVAKQKFEVRLASQDDIVELVADGTKVEDATETDPGQGSLPV